MQSAKYIVVKEAVVRIEESLILTTGQSEELSLVLVVLSVELLRRVLKSNVHTVAPVSVSSVTC